MVYRTPQTSKGVGVTLGKDLCSTRKIEVTQCPPLFVHNHQRAVEERREKQWTVCGVATVPLGRAPQLEFLLCEEGSIWSLLARPCLKQPRKPKEKDRTSEMLQRGDLASNESLAAPKRPDNLALFPCSSDCATCTASFVYARVHANVSQKRTGWT